MEVLADPQLVSALAAFGFICLGCVFAVGGSALVGARTLPGRVSQDAESAVTDVARLERNFDELRGQWAVTIEQLEVLSETIERRRKKAAASASRAETAEQNHQQNGNGQMTLDDARRLVYGGR